VTCSDSVDPGGFTTFSVQTDGNGNASSQTGCFSGDGPDHWVTASGAESNHVSWSVAQPTPPPPAPEPQPAPRSIQIGWSSSHPGWITMTMNGFPIGQHQYSCDFASGGDASFTLTETSSPETWDNGHTCFDFIHGDTVWVSVEGVDSNHIAVP
jgi:hypothetical protein